MTEPIDDETLAALPTSELGRASRYVTFAANERAARPHSFVAPCPLHMMGCLGAAYGHRTLMGSPAVTVREHFEDYP